MSEIDLYTLPQLISTGIFWFIMGFCIGNIFQILIREKTKQRR